MRSRTPPDRRAAKFWHHKRRVGARNRYPAGESRHTNVNLQPLHFRYFLVLLRSRPEITLRGPENYCIFWSSTHCVTQCSINLKDSHAYRKSPFIIKIQVYFLFQTVSQSRVRGGAKSKVALPHLWVAMRRLFFVVVEVHNGAIFRALLNLHDESYSQIAHNARDKIHTQCFMPPPDIYGWGLPEIEAGEGWRGAANFRESAATKSFTWSTTFALKRREQKRAVLIGVIPEISQTFYRNGKQM